MGLDAEFVRTDRCPCPAKIVVRITSYGAHFVEPLFTARPVGECTGTLSWKDQADAIWQARAYAAREREHVRALPLHYIGRPDDEVTGDVLMPQCSPLADALA